MEIITGVERRRRWRVEDKLRIVAEAEAPGSVVSHVARRHQVSRGLRRGMNGLAFQVQQALQRDPHAGDLYVFRGKRCDLVKILWHDGVGMSLYVKRLERGRFI